MINEALIRLGYCSRSCPPLSLSMSVGSGSSKKVGRSLGVYFSPVEVNAPESLMNTARAVMPLGVPRSSGRASSWYSFRSFVHWGSYRSHVLMTYSRVCSLRVSPHSQSTLLSGKICFRNSPVYAWPVLCFEFNRLLRKIWEKKQGCERTL